MTYERFKEILQEYTFTQEELDDIWRTRPTDDLDEQRLRRAALRSGKQLRQLPSS